MAPANIVEAAAVGGAAITAMPAPIRRYVEPPPWAIEAGIAGAGSASKRVSRGTSIATVAAVGLVARKDQASRAGERRRVQDATTDTATAVAPCAGVAGLDIPAGPSDRRRPLRFRPRRRFRYRRCRPCRLNRRRRGCR